MIKQLLTAILFAFAASCVFAAIEDSNYKKLDENNDGLISKYEATVSQTVTKQWDMLDKNQDGYLDSNEIAHLSEVKPTTK